MTIDLQMQGAVAEIAMRPADGDRLDTRLVTLLGDILEKVASASEVRAVVLRGDHDFCVGRRGNASAVTEGEILTDLESILRVNQLLREMEAVVVAGIEGAALGFGMGLVVHSDVAVAAADATFALPELAHGIPPLLVVPALARRTGPGFAMALATTGRTIGAVEAREVGIVSEVAPTGSAVVRAREIAQHISRIDQEAVALLRSVGPELCELAPGEAAVTGARVIASFISRRTMTSSPEGQRA